MDIEADVVAVGCGIAGLSAAVSAQQAGAKVALLERAPKRLAGREHAIHRIVLADEKRERGFRGLYFPFC